jgi:hypothetical protein
MSSRNTSLKVNSEEYIAPAPARAEANAFPDSTIQIVPEMVQPEKNSIARTYSLN